MHKIIICSLFLCILVELNLKACIIPVRVPHESYSSNIAKSDQFSKWIRTYGRIYKDSTRRVARFKVWLIRDNEISVHNEYFNTGQATFKQEHTRFSDRTNEELATSILGFKFPSTASRKSSTMTTIKKVNLPKQIDWRTIPGKKKDYT